MGYKDIAIDYSEAGLNPVPLRQGGKVPIRRDWGSPINSEIEDFDFEEIGICTGAVSGGLEGIDFDLKYAEDPDELWDSWKAKIPTHILKQMVVSKTKNDGYHVIYRTDVVEGNKKLAKNKNKEVLIETRGEGGYLKCYPSEGYDLVYGNLTKINKISDYDRAILMSTSVLFDETLVKQKKYYSDDKEFVDPFPKYNANPDIGMDLLEEHGWTVERESDKWVEFTRPGKTDGISAGYNLEGNFLYVFSTSTDFDEMKPYSNSAIFCMLKFDGDFRRGYNTLRDKGYGVEHTDTEEEELDNLDFLSKEGEDEDKLIQAIDGTIPIGVSYGWPQLDEYLVWKDNTLNFMLSFEGVGKTYVTLHQLVALSVLYGKKFAISCGENEVYNTKQVLIESLSGKEISYFKGNYLELKGYKDFINTHFFIMKNDVHYSVEQVLERAEKLHELYGISGVFIDPFSYYKKSPTNQYAYVDNLLSELNIFAKTVCSVIMSLHPVTEATRAPLDAEGYPKCPSRYSAVFGNIWANRSDSFILYHRIPNHKIPAMRRIMEIRVEKVKDISTGGKITPIDASIGLTYKEVDGFTGYFDNNGINPIKELQSVGKKKKQEGLPKMSPGDVF
jgi:hypothetical protein